MTLRLEDHPRAQRSIARAKAIGALLAFAVAALLSWRAGLMAEDVLLRALVAGIAGHLLAWAGAVVVWRQLAQAEIEVERRRLLALLAEAERLAGDVPPRSPA